MAVDHLIYRNPATCRHHLRRIGRCLLTQIRCHRQFNHHLWSPAYITVGELVNQPAANKDFPFLHLHLSTTEQGTFVHSSHSAPATARRRRQSNATLHSNHWIASQWLPFGRLSLSTRSTHFCLLPTSSAAAAGNKLSNPPRIGHLSSPPLSTAKAPESIPNRRASTSSSPLLKISNFLSPPPTLPAPPPPLFQDLVSIRERERDREAYSNHLPHPSRRERAFRLIADFSSSYPAALTSNAHAILLIFFLLCSTIYGSTYTKNSKIKVETFSIYPQTFLPQLPSNITVHE